MNEFTINTNGKCLLNKSSKAFYEMLIGLPLFTIIISFAIYISTKGEIILLIWNIIVFLIIYILGPIYLKIRMNKVVHNIKKNNDEIKIYAKNELTFLKTQLKFKEVKGTFTGFNKYNQNGILVETNDGKEFWIISTFFNEYEELKNILLDK